MNFNNILLASGLETAVESLNGWPLALVICVGMICISSFWMGRWPWDRK